MEQLLNSLAIYTPKQIAFGALVAVFMALFISIVLVRIRRRLKRSARQWVVVDGSNVMYWKTGKPRLDAVSDIVTELTHSGWSVVVIFDANAGYLVSNKYRHDPYFAQALGLPTKQVMVVPKGTPPDPFILKAARFHNSVVVTNDRFRDWKDDFPEVMRQGFLTRVEKRNGNLRLELTTAAQSRAS